MMQQNPATVETWEPRWSQKNHRAFTQCFRFAFAVAVVLLLASLAIAPSVLAQNSASGWVNSGLAKYEKGDLDGAIADFNRAIGIDPKYAPAYNNRGAAKLIKGDLDGAIADFNRAIGINPKNALAYYNRGVGKGNKGDLEGAVADYNRAIEIDPNYALAYYNRGFAKLKKGDLDGAIADFNSAIEINPNNALAYYNRGVAKLKKGDLDEAIADFNRAIEIDPKNALAYYNRGNAFQAKGQFFQAVANLNRAIELNRNHEYAYLRLLIATWSDRGDASAAMDKLRNHVAANSSDEWVRTISKYYLGIGKLNEQAILAEARKGTDGKKVGERLCEAYYYLAVKRLVGGNRKGAVEYFTLSIDTDIKRFTEYDASKAMLRLMKEGKI